MLVDLIDTPHLRTDPRAVIVVGSGAAGIAVAGCVADSGRAVVLLESGSARSLEPDVWAGELNTGSVSGLRYNGLTLGRARTLGGTTALWHGQVMRLHEIDLEARHWIPGSGWPFDLVTLDPYYKRAESWLRVSGLGYGAERWHEHPRLPPVGWTPEHLLHDFTEYLARPMLGRTHRKMLTSHPHLTTVTSATAGTILLAPDGRCRGVSVFAPDGTSFDVAGDSVVLAAGAIENARLLQLSDPAGVGLGQGREHTGRYLQDHPVIRTAEVVATDPLFLQDRYVALHRGQRRLFPKVRLSPELQRREGLVDATAVFVHEHDQPALEAARRLVLDLRAHRRPASARADLRAALQAPSPVLRDAYRRYARGLSTGHPPSRVGLQLWLEQVPDPQSRVRLGRSKDRFGMSQVDVDWRVHDLEIETSRRMTRLIATDLERVGAATTRELPPMHDDEAWRASVDDAFHPSGTTRMAASGRDGVVDPDLQVHGVPGLHVVGGSVFPIGGYANPTLTIVALALRLGDVLARRG